MRVLFIASGNKKNGLSPIILSQAESLVDAGLNVDFFPLKGKGVKGYLRSILLLYRYLGKSGPFDVVHAHYSLSGFVASLAGAKPLVVSLMGSDTKLNWFYRILITFFNYFFWSACIIKSQEMKSLRLKSSWHIPNGVNLNLFHPIQQLEAMSYLNWDESKIHVLFASDPERPEKNYIAFKNAIAEIAEYSIVVHVLTDITHELVPLFLNASHTVTLPSLWEGSPNIIKEAMACNRPVVVTDVGDSKWLIKGVEGCFVTSGEKEDYSEKLKNSIEYSIAKKETNGRNRLQFIQLDSVSVANRIIHLYKIILNKENLNEIS